MSCSYAAPGSRKKHSGTSSSSNSPGDMQTRIDRLEGLVLSLMTNGAQSAGPAAANRSLSLGASTASMEYPPDIDVDGGNHHANGMMRSPDGEGPESETDQVAQSMGVLKVYDNKSMYFGEAHWAAILQDIAEVKNYFAEHKKQIDEQAQKVQASKTEEAFPQGPTFLFGGVNPPEFPELLSSLPQKVITDKVIARYFNSYDPAILLCLAMHSYYKMGDEPPEYRGKSMILANKYRSLTAQCLLRADFLKPSSPTIETLILHLHGEFANNRDAEVGNWVLVGIIVRLAMRMGYHRDSKLFPNVTPFQGEMRRRIWTFVRQADLLFSFQLGLPSMIRLGDCDTALPGNYYDGDLFEEMKELPPPRPVTEPTPVSYMIAKASLSFCFGKIVESLHSIRSCTYEDIMQLDQSLREARAELPPHLRLKPIEDSMMEPPEVIMQRFFLSILYHKGQCVLHRKFLARARENTKYAHSRRTCVDSSMELLNHQATLHYESGPGQRISNVRALLSSLTTHDFLLAAMIISLDLWYGAEAEQSVGGGGRSNSADLFTWGLERRDEMIRALEVSNDIWKETRDQSMESYKANEILTIIIAKMKDRVQPGGGGGGGSRQAASAPFPFPSLSNGNANSPYPPNPGMEDKPEHSAAMTLGMLSSGGLSSNNAPTANMLMGSNGGGASGYPNPPNPNVNEMQGLPAYTMDQSGNGIPSAPSPFSFMTGGGEMANSIDWDAWDSYIQNAGIDTGVQMWAPHMDPAGGLSAQQQQQQAQQQQAQQAQASMEQIPGANDHHQQGHQNNLFASGHSPFAGGMPL
ncbi:MAG: hypothetical protein Q9173_005028 [Seirophora scorigena]